MSQGHVQTSSSAQRTEVPEVRPCMSPSLAILATFLADSSIAYKEPSSRRVLA